MAARWWMRKRAICGIASALALIAIALGVGLGIGLSRRSAAAAAAQATCTPPGSGRSIELSASPPTAAGRRVGEAFVSFAFEFTSFAVFAGNTSQPNEYSNNLLNNIGNLTGTKPYIRIGGTSADEAILDPSQSNATLRKQDTGLTNGPQQQLSYGESYFQSFGTWPDARYIYGFNMAFTVGPDATVGFMSLNATVPLICQALADDDRFLYWEYGNEPNLYPSVNHGYVDAASWGPADYVREWTNGTAVVREQLQADGNCAGLTGSSFGVVGPSLWEPDPGASLNLGNIWNGGFDDASDLRMISIHRYGASSNNNHLTIANTLLNHTLIKNAVNPVVQSWANLGDSAPPLMIGETNSVSNIGVPGVTNTLAGALWAMDWALWCASQNVSRLHFQQGGGFWYNAWQPATVNNSVFEGTKPPYYGHLSAASAIGESASSSVQVYAHDGVNSSVSGTDTDAIYSVYSDGVLSRLAVLNLREYDASSSNARGSQSYTFAVPGGSNRNSVLVRRLLGPSSDATGGVQWDGQQFDVTSNGLASSTNNVTTGEKFLVCNGTVTVSLEDSSAAVLEFMG